MKFGYLTLCKCQPECFLFGNSVNGVQMAARGLATPPGSLPDVSGGRIQGTREPGGEIPHLYSPQLLTEI